MTKLENLMRSRLRIRILVASLYVLIGSFGTVVLLTPATVNAASCTPKSQILGIPTWYKYLDGEDDARTTLSGEATCSPIFNGPDSIGPIGVAILEAMLRLAGLVAVVMIFWASFTYITTQGSGESAAAARKTAINALIGLVIVIISTGLVSFIGNRLISS
jgi:Type IV secretion system pilin